MLAMDFAKIILIGLLFVSNIVYAQESKITVLSFNSKSAVNKKIFGNNFLGYDPALFRRSNKHYYGHADYGAGLWDSTRGKIVNEPAILGKEIGINIVRFPGGMGANFYEWKQAIGKRKEHFLFGIDEFLRVCEYLEAEAIYTVNCFTNDEKDLRALLQYLRTYPQDRHQCIRYFEIGNELYDRRFQLTAKGYIEKYRSSYSTIKAADESFKVGVILYTEMWNENVLKAIRDRVDFGILHIYPTPVWGEKVSEIPAKDIFAITLALPETKYQASIRKTLALLKKYSGKNVPLAITEFNGGFVQDKPVPYRHCLGTALVNAELLRIFMKPENNILMANYWNFCNEYWGMIANGFKGDPKDLYKPYYKRPNYYVFEMYAKHFGDILIEADVKSDSYDVSMYKPFYEEIVQRIKTGTVIKNNVVGHNWEVRNLAGIEAEEKNGVLNINFTAPQSFNYFHASKKGKVEPKTYYKLSGYIKTENLNDPVGVCLEVQDGRGWNVTHSALSTERVTGTTDWQYVETIYETLPDATSATVIARRIGNKGPLEGKAYFKDVKLEKFVPDLDSRRIPYLSVNASKSKDGKKVYLMVINKNMDSAMTTTIELKDFNPRKEANAWVLNGPSIDATNEKKHDNVKVRHKKFVVGCRTVGQLDKQDSRGIQDQEQTASCSFEYTFEKHSLTAIELERQ